MGLAQAVRGLLTTFFNPCLPPPPSTAYSYRAARGGGMSPPRQESQQSHLNASTSVQTWACLSYCCVASAKACAWLSSFSVIFCMPCCNDNTSFCFDSSMFCNSPRSYGSIGNGKKKRREEKKRTAQEPNHFGAKTVDSLETSPANVQHPQALNAGQRLIIKNWSIFIYNLDLKIKSEKVIKEKMRNYE